jgi:flagellar basal-body rod protein FlgB
MFGMDLAQIPLFATLRGRLGYLNQRQRVISENVANADTPGFQPRDLKPFTVRTPSAAGVASASGGGGMLPVTITQPGHMLPPNAAASGVQPVSAPDSETRLDGNSVVLEEEMMKLSDARTNFQAAIDFYEQSLNMLKTASQAPK